MNKDTTVLIASYNHGSVLVYQLESLLKQTAPPERIIVLDDGSTDDTQCILESYRKISSIQVISFKKNMGIHAALCRLMMEVKTKFFAFASADDLLTSEWCDTMSSLLEDYPEAKMAISNTFIVEGKKVIVTDLVIGSNGKAAGVLSPQAFAEAVCRIGKLPPSNTIMYRSDIIHDLILPVFSQKHLGSFVDVMLILTIATRYPTAYATKPTGIFIRRLGSYGSSPFDIHLQRDIAERIEQVSHSGKLLEPAKFANFVNKVIKFTWAKKAVALRQAENRVSRTGMKYLWAAIVLLAKTFAIYIVFDRIKYFRFSSLRRSQRINTLAIVIDESVLRRLII